MGVLPQFACLAAAGLWVVGVWMIGFLRLSRRPRAVALAVVAGVPILGWVTFECGPIAGMLTLVLGLAMLMRPRLAMPGRAVAGGRAMTGGRRAGAPGPAQEGPMQGDGR